MDLSWLVGPLLALASVWALLVALVWFLRPRDVALPEVLRVIPDVVRLVRRLIGDRSVPIDARCRTCCHPRGARTEEDRFSGRPGPA